ncbi:GNAT family protein [Aquibacillus rhizosphaerae]|uniref:GNAT family N-acetyltransferase n=1 Tax=Aquibacillus rhizosphaerae TaxID=3051431 RepID=A0ABT7LC20_9BACI|nr:hypothetical protein [Aquibacillus sp. LR5S19]MDL4842125.1 hypothetical protein [Aquibacillus sp. LR5S19]
MKIINYQKNDTEAIVSLFYETVHSIYPKYYFQTQLEAWAPIDEKESRVGT